MGRRKGYERVDERTDLQRREMPFLVVGIDSFLSGWGPCEKGLSVAAWACRDEDTGHVLKWVKARSDIRKARLVDERDFMGRVYPVSVKFPGVAHYHVYAVDVGHPALATAAAA